MLGSTHFSPNILRPVVSLILVLFSQHLSPAKRNYDVRDWELFVVKLTFKEWRHCLEESEQPFIIWNDHKNLVYLQNARRLNACQARMVIMFLLGLTSLSPIALGTETVQLMHCLHESPTLTNLKHQKPTYHCPALWGSWEVHQSGSEGWTQPRYWSSSLFFSWNNQNKCFSGWKFQDNLLSCFKSYTKASSEDFWWPTMSKDIGLFQLALPMLALRVTTNLHLVSFNI